MGTIHGDLNLENILVDPAIREINLIDFAAAREDHVLHDFLRLEAEVATKLIPDLLAQANLGAGVIRPFYEQLHQFMLEPGLSTLPELPHPTLAKPFTMLASIRKAARHYFFKWDDWAEYYQGLVLYILGALKFANLDQMVEAPAPLPKQVAFLGAAVVTGLMEGVRRTEETKKILMQSDNQTSTSGRAAQPVGKPVTFLDFFSPFEVGLERLLQQMGQNHPRYADFLAYQGRLTENIRRSRRFGNTADRQAERAEVIDLLNELALSTLGISFNELCKS
jgi:hypothetical protein